ncbi:MAG: transposase family protein, partial [Paludibacteraceae bacterium]
LDNRIVWLSETYYGSVHDKKICDIQPLSLPLGIFVYQDTGFLGHNPEGTTVIMPTKKPKGKELTKEQKEQNKEISSIRIGIEHAIGRAKKWRIVKDTFRCRKFGFAHKVMLIACGLHNFSISLKTNAIVI